MELNFTKSKKQEESNKVFTFNKKFCSDEIEIEDMSPAERESFRKNFTKRWNEVTDDIKGFSVRVPKTLTSTQYVLAEQDEEADIIKTSRGVQYRGSGRKLKYV